MPPVRSVKNQYHGINAHLQSWHTTLSNGGYFCIISLVLRCPFTCQYDPPSTMVGEVSEP